MLGSAEMVDREVTAADMVAATDIDRCGCPYSLAVGPIVLRRSTR
jgi:hypothetical protein